MRFAEEYLTNVVAMDWKFSHKEQNILTYQVWGSSGRFFRLVI